MIIGRFPTSGSGPDPDPDRAGRDRRRPGFDPNLDSAEAAHHAKPSEVDFELDPLLRLERHQRSGKQAIAFGLAVPILTLLTAFVVAGVSRVRGGPICDAGESTWICTRNFEILYPLIPWGVSLIGFGAGLFITLRKWKTYQAWRHWLVMVWFLSIFCIGWFIATGHMLIIGAK